MGWGYFGGGLNKDDAHKIFVKDINGLKVAFLGYNYYDTINNNVYALATSTHAGANRYNLDTIKQDIKKAHNLADFVIVDFQFRECYCYPHGYVYYPICYRPIPHQKEVFRKAIDFGANIVVGTQAHQPQTYEIYNNGVVFYGLGNLFFDQTFWPGTQHGIVLTHYFINQKYVQTKLTTTNYKQDLQTYITTGVQRQKLLKLLSDAR